MLFSRRKREQDLEREIRAHLDLEAAEHRDPSAAHRAFGNAAMVKEDVRAAWGFTWWHASWHDLRYGCRVLKKSPVFTAAAALTLAIAIGANTAIFTLVNAALLRPLPYREPNRLVQVWSVPKRYNRLNTVSAVDLAVIQSRNTVFEDMAYSDDSMFTVTGRGAPISAGAGRFSANLFSLLGAHPFLGRTFTPDEGTPGHDAVVILSYRLWERLFALDRAALGQSINLEGKPYTVIGVMPPGFAHPHPFIQMWVPFSSGALPLNEQRARLLRVVARLKPGATEEAARAQLSAIADQLAREHPETNQDWGAALQPLRDYYFGDVRPTLVVLQGAVVMMLLIACANIANLLLVRANAREREVTVRLALGAGRMRLFRQFLAEGLLLASAAAGMGILLAHWSIRGVPRVLSTRLADVLFASSAGPVLDVRVLAFTTALALAAGVLFGFVPLWRRAPQRLGEALKSATRGATEGRAKAAARNVLVTAQVAMSLILLAGAGLMMRSMMILQSRDFGFRTDRVLTMFLPLPGNHYGDPAKSAAFIEEVTRRVQSTPGVKYAATATTIPLGLNFNRRAFSIPGMPEQSGNRENNAEFRAVGPDYFRALDIRLVRGRFFTDQDRRGAKSVVIISETMARRFWPHENPVGKQIVMADGITPQVREIAGVVSDTLAHGLASDHQLEVYRPAYQVGWPFYNLVIQTAGDPLAIASAVQKTVWSLDADLPINNTASMEQLAWDSLMSRRLLVYLLAGFSAVALFLACMGIYGVIAYSVSQRTAEIGIRMALGASAGDVLLGVLATGCWLALSGVAAGLAGALTLTGFLRGMLFGVTAHDPATLAAVSLLMFAIAVAAAVIPARRAARIDPMAALRYE